MSALYTPALKGSLERTLKFQIPNFKRIVTIVVQFVFILRKVKEKLPQKMAQRQNKNERLRNKKKNDNESDWLKI